MLGVLPFLLQENGGLARSFRKPRHQSEMPAVRCLDSYIIYTPVAHARAIEPIVKKGFPGSAGVRFQLALKVGHANNPEIVLGINRSHEVKECRLAQLILDHADDASAAVITHAE